VGGFSNFWLSQKTVMEFFGSTTLSDKRFEQDFVQEDVALSISKGASLLAKDIISEELIYPISISIFFYSIDDDGDLKEELEVLLRKGDIVKVDKPKYSKTKIISIGRPKLLLNDGVVRRKIVLDNEKIETIFPNYNVKNNYWYVGASMDRNSFYYLHFKDKKGVENKIELSDIIKDFRETIFIEKDRNDGVDILKILAELNDKYARVKSNSKGFKKDISSFGITLQYAIEKIVSCLGDIMGIHINRDDSSIEQMKKLEEGDKKIKNIYLLHNLRRFRNFLVHNYNEHRVLSEQDKAKIVTRMEKSINNIKTFRRLNKIESESKSKGC